VRETNAQKLKRYRDAAVAKGLCYVCRCRPQRPGTRYCEPCIEKAAIARIKTYHERIARAECGGCGEPSSDDHAFCDGCRAQQHDLNTARYAARRAAGLCVKCGETSGDKCLCDRCAESHGELMRERYYDCKARCVCPTCGAPSVRTVFCPDCTARMHAYRSAR
jgi:hypothetical protein